MRLVDQLSDKQTLRGNCPWICYFRCSAISDDAEYLHVTVRDVWMCAKLSCFRTVWLFGTPWTVARQSPLSWDSPGKNSGVGCPAILQEIFPSQGSNPRLLCLLLLLSRFSHVRLLATPWTAAYQAPLSMGFSRQEYWSGVPLPSLLLCLPALIDRFLTTSATWEARG